MRLKSAYREKPVEQPPDIPPEPSEKISIEVHDTAVPDIAAIEPADEATLTLQNQIAHLKKSEQMQREFAQHVAAQRAVQMAAPEALPADPTDRIALWRTQGLDEGDAAFLSEHLEMAERPDLTRLASDEAAEHHQRGTDDHRQLTKEIFDQHLALQQPQPAASARPAPAFQPRSVAPSLAAAPDRSSLYAAPVSRTTSPGGYREPSPRSVRLSPVEQEIARNLGLSDVAYAEGKIRLQKAKANGELQ